MPGNWPPGGAVTSAGEDWATVRCPDGDIDFQTAPGYQPPPGTRHITPLTLGE
jgi:hypothetical protein